MLVFLFIYFVGCILAVCIQEIRLWMFKNKFGNVFDVIKKKFRSTYILFILTSWFGFITVLFSIIYLKWKRIL